MKIGFIGAGRVGFTLGKYMKLHGVDVVGYYNRNVEHAREAADFTDTLCYETIDDLVRGGKVVYIPADVWNPLGYLDNRRLYESDETHLNPLGYHLLDSCIASVILRDMKQK